MVGGDDDRALGPLDGVHEPAELQIDRLDGEHRGLEVAGVADHVAVREVDAQVLDPSALDGREGGVGDLRRLHPGALLEGDVVAGDLDVVLERLVELARAVAVPEVGHVAVLLGLAAGELGHAVVGEVLAEGALDVRRVDQEVLGELQVAVVLHHARVEDVRSLPAVEGVEVVLVEGAADLDGAVAAEVEEDDGGAVADRSDRLAVLGDHEGRQELIGGLRVLFVEAPNRLAQTAEGAIGLAVHVGVPAALDHRPVRLVAVHGGGHPPAAGGDPVVTAVRAQLLQQRLEGLHVAQGAPLTDVAAIEERVDPRPLDALLGRPAEHGVQVVLVAVDVPVREQPDEVQGLAALLHPGDGVLPDLALEDLAALDGQLHQLGALVEDAAGAEGVVADLAVAHVVVAGQADGGAVGGQGGGHRALQGRQGIQVRGPGDPDGVALVAAADADAVHDDHQDRALDASEGRVLLELLHAHEGLCSTSARKRHRRPVPFGSRANADGSRLRR